MPIGQAGSYFDLTMRPGDIRILDVEIANDGDGSIGARTYAADVYTIINGGFGGRLRNEPQTGTTRWLDYPTAELDLAPGSRTTRSFTVAVPSNAGAGEYISSLILENDQPTQSGGGVALNQVVRQAVAVVITVPGPRAPALGIGAATHTIVAGKSVVAVAVENDGNVRLKPVAEFTLLDATGATVSRATVPMDTFYAWTKTLVEVPLAARLLPGTYTVQFSLVDDAEGVRAAGEGIHFVVAAPAASAADPGVAAGLTEVTQGLNGGPVGFPAIAVAVIILAAFLFVGLILVIRRRRKPGRQMTGLAT